MGLDRRMPRKVTRKATRKLTRRRQALAEVVALGGLDRLVRSTGSTFVTAAYAHWPKPTWSSAPVNGSGGSGRMAALALILLGLWGRPKATPGGPRWPGKVPGG